MTHRSLDKKNVLRDTSYFSGSTYVAQAMFFIRGFLNARILGPGLYGVWSALNIILKYSTFAHLGTFNAMAREIPYENGKGSSKAMDKVRNVALAFTLSMILAFSAALIIIAISLRKTLALNEAIGMITIALLAIVMCFYEFYQTSFIAVKRFLLISKVSVIFPVLSVILTLVLVPRLKIYGVYIVAVTTPLLTVLYLIIKEPLKLRLDFDLKETFRLMKIGFPIMSVDFLQGTIVSLAGILVLTFLGKVNMGYYSVAILATTFLMYFPLSIHRAFEPHIYERFGQTHDILEIKKYFFKPTLVMALLFPVVLAGYYTGVKFFVLHFLPKYTISLYPFIFILLGRFFLAFSPTAIAFITSISKQKFLVPVYVVGISIVSLSSLIFINRGLGIVGVSIGLFLAFFFIGSVIFIYALNHYMRNKIRCVLYFFSLCAPLLYMGIVVLFIERYIQGSSAVLLDAVALSIKLGMILIFSLPLLYIAHKKTEVIKEVLGSLKVKI